MSLGIFEDAGIVFVAESLPSIILLGLLEVKKYWVTLKSPFVIYK